MRQVKVCIMMSHGKVPGCRWLANKKEVGWCCESPDRKVAKGFCVSVQKRMEATTRECSIYQILFSVRCVNLARAPLFIASLPYWKDSAVSTARGYHLGQEGQG